MANVQKEKKEKKDTKLTCIITGKTVVFAKTYFEKKIQEFGDEERLRRLYVCKQALGLLKRGYSIDEIRKSLDVSTEYINDISEDTINEILHKDNKQIVFAEEPIVLNNTKPHVIEFLKKLKEYNVE